jgi:lipopolysaccharide export system protein LptA
MRIAIIATLLLVVVQYVCSAQATDSIQYRKSDSLIGSMTLGNTFNRLLGNVHMEQNGTVLLCDSAHWYFATNFIECFGNVRITASNGATVQAEYIKYTGGTAKAFLRGNVQIVDGNNTITSDELDYNVRTKVAVYQKGATLQSDETTLVSNEGNYNGKTKDAIFRGDVVVTNPKYEVSSKHLKYNTERKFVTFLDASTIITEDATIEGKKGTYDANKEEGRFTTRSTVVSEEQEITANNLYYNKKTGAQLANGNVNLFDNKDHRRLLCEKLSYNSYTTKLTASGDVQIDEFADARILVCEYAEYIKRNTYMRASKNVVVYDSAQATILQCDTIEYNFERNLSLAKGSPVLRMLADKDSLFIRADYLYSAPYDAIDTLVKFYVPSNVVADSTAERNSSVKSTLLGRGNVRMYTDSMQAMCDSLSYNQVDSVFRLFKDPILWASGSQASADTIYMVTQSNKAKHLSLRGSAFIVSDTKATDLYDQISGRTIEGDIVDEALDELFVDGNAQSIYFNKNEKDEYEGMNRAEAAQLRIKMRDKKVSRISFYTLPKGKMVPMNKLNDAQKKLDGFNWLEARRPKNKLEIISFKIVPLGKAKNP